MAMQVQKQHNINNIMLFCIALFCICWLSSDSSAAASSAAVFLFGDSILDVGTNNYVNGSTATANNPYYGIDYSNSTATGRFSNGNNTADFLVSLLNISDQSPPPFLALVQDMENFRSNIFGGVNFASGGSGILFKTGHKAFKNVIPMKQQIEQFETVCGNITQELGSEKAGNLISNALYIISAGSNDLFDYNRFNPGLSGPDFIAKLTKCFAHKLKILYGLGARKFAIVGVAPIGCCPAILSSNGGACNETLNNLARALHESTHSLLQKFKHANPGIHFALGNSYKLSRPIIEFPGLGGFNDSKNACCGQGPNKGQGKCLPTSDLCTDRDASVFFDLFHPTERASSLAAMFLVTSGAPLVTPFNFTTLAKIHV